MHKNWSQGAVRSERSIDLGLHKVQFIGDLLTDRSIAVGSIRTSRSLQFESEERGLESGQDKDDITTMYLLYFQLMSQMSGIFLKLTASGNKAPCAILTTSITCSIRKLSGGN